MDRVRQRGRRVAASPQPRRRPCASHAESGFARVSALSSHPA